MDSNRIRNLATGAREALRNEVKARLDAVLAEGSAERLESAEGVRRIEADVASRGRDEVVDRAAYTWFNRLCALRFMDANGYTPTPVVTPREGSTQPAVLADAAQGMFDPEYGVRQDARQRVTDLLSGAIASANAVEDAYALLLGVVCERYAGPMPYLFSEDVASSLLMPRGLLAQGSILSRIIEDMDGEACADVEVLGWLYQFYIAERKDQVFAAYKKGKKAQATDIAPATQLFTPAWIVQYMTENSLGRLWMLNSPESELAASMEYYVAPEGDELHIDISSADEIRVLDPACGSGHILVYAFDLLFKMYEEEGWPTEDIPRMILENNLYGLEIDRRAAEIASFALEMKARERDPRWFEKRIDAHVRVLEPVELLPQELELVPQLAELGGLLDAMAHLGEVGSLYVPDGLDEFVLTNELEHVEHDGSLFAGSAISKLRVMLANVKALNRSYHCVIANPPYMGSGNMNPWLSAWIKANYPEYKSDLFSAFISRNIIYSKDLGELGFMSPYVWMFISSYEQLRKLLIEGKTITSLIQLEYSGFAEATVPVCTFTITNQRIHGYRGGYIRLSDFVGAQVQAPKTLEAVRNPDCGWFYRASADGFKAIPGWPIAYWASEAMLKGFKNYPALTRVFRTRQGFASSDNKRFLRLWWEPSLYNIAFGLTSREQAKASHRKWFPCNKGGGFRKWYGYNEYVANWQNDGEEMLSYAASLYGSPTRTIKNIDIYFQGGMTWGTITSGSLSMRHSDDGFIPEHAGGMIPIKNWDERASYVLGAMNSSSVAEYLKVLSPTLRFTEGPVGLTPIPLECDDESRALVVELVKEAESMARTDWDSFETSWDFVRHPMAHIPDGTPEYLANCYARWEAECRERFDRLKANEEELNRIFARIYHMEGEVPIEVPDDKVSVRLADRVCDSRSLVSYIVGCLFGRYSTEAEGLVLADQGGTVDDFQAKVPGATFLPDYDNVLPILADEWFDDDVVAGIRRWLAHAYGEGALEENVAWLEESLGKDLRTYLCKDFYSDHLKVYQKRPIYWMYQSPKKSFQCLVYMHRYDEGTVGTILTGYLRPLQDKLRARLQVLESPGARAVDVREANRVRGMIAELEQWERDVVYPLAHERVSIDLDDGVKVNYNRFPRALAKVPGLSDWK